MINNKQAIVLHLVRQFNAINTPATAYSIARAAGVTHVTARRRLEELRAMGMIKQSIDLEDNRQRPRLLSFLSSSGKVYCSMSMHIFLHWQSERLGQIS